MKMEEYAADFIKMGTYLLMMKLKFMAYRTLCKGVHQTLQNNVIKDGPQLNKISLEPFEKAFAWQDDCDADETACIVTGLMFQGAIKGYLSNEHRKVVLAKDTPFPP